MPSGSGGGRLIHWEKTVPFGLTVTPANMCYGLAIVIIIAVYLRMRVLRNAAKASATIAASKDKAWDENTLRWGTADLFRKIQTAWNQGHIAGLGNHLEARVLQEWTVRLAEMDLDGERRKVANIEIVDVEILNAKDYLDDSKDEFTAKISFNAVETAGRGDGPDQSENGMFVEYWKMGRWKDTWKVREVMRDGVLAKMSLALEPSVREGGSGAG